MSESIVEISLSQKSKVRGKSADTAAKHVVSMMRYLRKVFWQDLPLYYEKYPHLSIFECRLLTDHRAAFNRWCEMSKSVRQEQQQILHQAGGAPSVLLKETEGLGEVFLSMKVVPNSFVAPPGFCKSSLPGSRFFSRLEWVRNWISW